MKNNFFRALVLLTCGALASCSGFMGVNLTNQKSVDDNLRKFIEKEIDPQAEILQIRMMTISDFSKTIDIANVYYFPVGETEIAGLTVSLTATGADNRKAHVYPDVAKRKPGTGIKLADADFSRIAANLADAATQMKEEDYNFDGIDSYEINFFSDPAETVHEFTLESKANTEMATRNGRAVMQTNYYTFKFTADNEGNVVFQE